MLDLLDHPFITQHRHLEPSQKQTDIANWIASCRSVFVSVKEPKVPAEVGHEFVLLYHSIFSSSRHLLSSLYVRRPSQPPLPPHSCKLTLSQGEESLFEFNGRTYRGRDAIMEVVLVRCSPSP